MLNSPNNADQPTRNGRWLAAALVAFATFGGAALIMESYTQTRAQSTVQQLLLRSRYYDEAVSYLKTFAGESEILNAAMIEGPGLFQIAGAIRLARNSEALAFVLYQHHAAIPEVASTIGENIDDIHRMFDVGTKEMLAGANSEGNQHIVTGAGLFQASLKLADSTINEINARQTSLTVR